jgi:uroporphyrin-III C-methyltransferase
MSDTAESSAGPAPRPQDNSPPVANPKRAKTGRRGAGMVWLVLILAALLAAFGWYRYRDLFQGELATAPPPSAATTPDPALATDLSALRRSLDDASGVNRALREQVLGLTQRVGLLEDGFAGVERGAAPGVDGVRLAEADFLLRLGEERLRLFADVSGARAAFELADQQLAEVSDPRATSVRQTLALERDALAGIASADLPVILGRLDGLAAGINRWPLKGRASPLTGGDDSEPGWWKRTATVLDRYFRVRRTDPAEQSSGGPLLRERVALDLSRARLLLLRGEGEAARGAIEAVQMSLQSQFDTRDEAVAQALSVLVELRTAPLAPTLPALGESRRELARLRGLPFTNTPDPDLQPSANPDRVEPPQDSVRPGAPDPIAAAAAEDSTLSPESAAEAGPAVDAESAEPTDPDGSLPPTQDL